MPGNNRPATQAGQPQPLIAHLITDLHTGGAESMLVRLLSASSYRNASSVMSMRSRGTRGAQIDALGVPLETFGISLSPNGFRSAYNLHRAVRRSRPRVVQGWMYHANVAATLSTSNLADSVHVWNIRETLQDIRREKPLTRAVILLGAALSARPSAIVYNSHASAEQHERLGYSSRNAIVIPNGIDTDLYAPSNDARLALRAALGVSADTVLVGRIGRYHPMKDFSTMLAAAAAVSSMLPQVHYVLGGPGVTSDNREISKRIATHGLADKVHLVGDVKDVPAFMAGLDVNCSSSAWGEAFPNVIVEAMAAGVPCVTTDVGDSAYVLGNGGFVVPPSDPPALATALLKLLCLDNINRRAIGDAGRRRAQREFALRDVAARYDELYTHLMRESHA